MGLARKIDIDYRLDHALTRDSGAVFLSGMQALARLPLMQMKADRAAGRRTAALISGYRGSPLGGFDQLLWRHQAVLQAHDIVFQEGLNEDLAATAIWGTQQIAREPKPRYEGVVGFWYGKGPGVDRSADVLRNANAQGTCRLGGVLAYAGDDHGAQSSMFPHQTDQIFEAVMMPILNPATVEEYLTLGMAGVAMSRYSGCWVAFKTITETVESTTTVRLPEAATFLLPPQDASVEAGLNYDKTLRWPERRAELERRLVEWRLPAAQSFAAANRIDRVVLGSHRRRLGIVRSERRMATSSRHWHSWESTTQRAKPSA